MITDGYTRTCDAAGLRIEYRPLGREARRLFAQRLRLYRHARERLADRVLAESLVDWDRPEVVCWHAVEVLRAESPGVWRAIFRAVCGIEPRATESDDAANLAAGVRLQVLYPKVAATDCGYCTRWWHDPITGETAQRGGRPVPRPAVAVRLCETEEGCPKGTPEGARSLSERNRLAFLHYLECRAVGQWPDDPIVRRNARIIRNVIDRSEKDR